MPIKYLNNKLLISCIILLLFSNISSISGNSVKTKVTQESPDLEQLIFNSDVVAYYSSDISNIVPDGIIGENEYLDYRVIELEISNMSIYLQHNISHLFVGLSSYNAGWIALGINSFNGGMTGANFVLGNVVDNIPTVIDTYGTGHDQPIEDIDGGGTDDLIYSNGTESQGMTTLEFSIPLNSSDARDFPLTINQTSTIFLAWSPIDDFEEEHRDHSEKLNFFIAPTFLNVPARTDLDLVVESPTSTLELNENFTLKASITSSSNTTPLANLNVEFFIRSNFGDLFLGESKTNGNGVAVLETSIESYYITGSITFFAKFSGSMNFRVSTNTVENSINGESFSENENEYGFVLSSLTVIGALLTLGFIWLSFIFVLILLWRISRDPKKGVKTN